MISMLVVTMQCVAQDWYVKDTLEFHENITSYSIDPDNRIYIGTSSGSLFRYESTGKESDYYSGIANFEVTSISAWNRFRVFVFFEKPQAFYVLDRFNTISNTYELSEYSDGLISQCTPGVDNSLWALSTSYNELRKYNQHNKQLLFSNPLKINVSQVSHMRAFQNLLIISERTEGIKIFDQFGNLLTEINIPEVDHFQILGGKLVFYSQNQIYSMNPFSPKGYETVKAPKGAFTGVLKSEEDYFFFQRNRVLIFGRN